MTNKLPLTANWRHRGQEAAFRKEALFNKVACFAPGHCGGPALTILTSGQYFYL
jgi:hypothetical protein